MKSFPGGASVFFIGFLLFFVLAHAEDATVSDWKFFTSDKENDYYFNPKSKIGVSKGVFEIQVKAVCIDKEKFLSDIKAFGKRFEDYKKYSHTIFVAGVDCPNKRCLVKLVTEYDNKGKVIDYVAGALTNWVPVSKGTLYEILYQAACHEDAR